MSLREHVSLREHACVSSRGAQSTELVWILDFKQILLLLSTILFKIVTYMIMAELDRRGTGYNDEHIKIKSLFFADDALLLSHSLEEAKENLDIITDVSREFGLEINIEKSNVLIFNLKDQPEYLGNIKVVQKVKYLGIEIDNKRNYFKTHRQNYTKSPENGKHNI